MIDSLSPRATIASTGAPRPRCGMRTTARSAGAATARIASQSRCGVAGMSMCSIPMPESASITALISAAELGVMPASPPPLTRSALPWPWYGSSVSSMSNVGKLIRARHGVVHEARRQHLAGAWLPDQRFHHRLADALHDAAVHLAVQDQRIDRLAAVVDRRIAANLDRRRCPDRPRPRTPPRRSDRPECVR